MIPSPTTRLEGVHTTTDGLALALAGAAGTVAAVAVGEEQTGTGGEENCRGLMSMRDFWCWILVGVSRKDRSQNVPPCFMGKPVHRNSVSIMFLCFCQFQLPSQG